jgi:hypothetical protein
MLGHEPPIQRRSTTAVRRPDLAMSQANNLPPWPLPRTSTSTCSGDIVFPHALMLRSGKTIVGCGDIE